MRKDLKEQIYITDRGNLSFYPPFCMMLVIKVLLICNWFENVV